MSSIQHHPGVHSPSPQIQFFKMSGAAIETKLYHLDDGASQRIFTEQIVPDDLDGIRSALKDSVPIAVFAVGQTGAGKSNICPGVIAALDGNGRQPAHFIADTYKAYHPHYDKLMVSAPHLASRATGPDARKWLEMAVTEATVRRLDLIVESACRHPDDFTKLLDIVSKAGYRIEVMLLAVPAGLSLLGILIRFHQELPEGKSKKLPLRLTPPVVHDESYAGLANVAEHLDQTDMAHQVLVVRRGGLVAHGGTTGIAAALERERERPLTDDEIKKVMHDISLLPTDEKTGAKVEDIRRLLNPLISVKHQTGPADTTQANRFPQLVPMVFADASKNNSQGNHVLRLGLD